MKSAKIVVIPKQTTKTNVLLSVAPIFLNIRSNSSVPHALLSQSSTSKPYGGSIIQKPN